MNPLVSLRRDLLEAIYGPHDGPRERPPFIRRARESGFLFVTDAPRRIPHWDEARGRLILAGWPVWEQNELAYIDAPEGFYQEARYSPPPPCPKEALLPAWWLCRVAFRPGWNHDADGLDPVRSLLKAIDEGEGAVLAFCLSYPPQLSLALRKREAISPALSGFLSAWCAAQVPDSSKEGMSC